MLIGHSMPAVTDVEIVGEGAQWLTLDGPAALFDGKPARRARLLLGAAAAADTSASVALRLSLEAPTAVRLVALLGLWCPEGVLIEVRGRIAGSVAWTAALGGNADCQRTVRAADGSVNCLVVGDPSGQLYDGIEVRIYNDQNYTLWAGADTWLDIGEIFISAAVHVGIRDGWQVERVDPSVYLRSRGGQVSASARATYRRFTGEFSPRAVELVRKGGINGQDWETIAGSLSAGGRGLIVPQYRDIQTGELDPELAARTAMYGYAIELPGATSVQRQYFGSYMAFEEIPSGV